MSKSIDLNRLRATVVRNQKRGEYDPDAPQRTILVDRNARLHFGSDVPPDQRRALAKVQQDTFHASGSERARTQLEGSAARLAEALGAVEWSVFPKRWEDVELLAADFRLPGGFGLLVLAGPGFPGLPPLVLLEENGNTSRLDLRWDLDISPDERLSAALLEHFVPPGPYRGLYGPRRDLLLTDDAECARAAGWRRFLSGGQPCGERLAKELFARSGGLIGRGLSGKRVFVAGLGSGGSYVAEQLVRAGVGALDLVDPDVVEPANLSRTGYETTDVGLPKTEALVRRLLRIRPGLSVHADARPVGADGASALAGRLAQADLLVALTDDPRAQSLLNHAAWQAGTPAIFASLYRGALGGEVILSVPDRTPCYRCATAGVREFLPTAETERRTDYGTGRIEGETALAADIHHLDTATVKLALSLLLKGLPDSSLAKFTEGAIRRGFTYLCLSMSPDYWVFPALMGDTPGQYAYQGAWFSPEPDPECPVCGAPEHRAPLDGIATATPSPEQFQAIHE